MQTPANALRNLDCFGKRLVMLQLLSSFDEDEDEHEDEDEDDHAKILPPHPTSQFISSLPKSK
jgi:hypothetical protein